MSPGFSSAAPERLAELCDAGAQFSSRGRRPLGPHPHRRLFTDQRDQGVNRSRRLDVEGKLAPAIPVWRLQGHCRRRRGKSRIAPDFAELPLRRRKWNFEVPAWRAGSTRGPVAIDRSGSEATCSRVDRAIAPSVSASRWWSAVVDSGAFDTSVRASPVAPTATRREMAAAAARWYARR